jgi:hemolysin activation/secretion protein
MLLFFGGYSRVHAHVDDSTRTHGTSGQASMRYTIPLSPSTFLLHEATAGFDFKRSNNTLEFVETVPVIGQEVNLTQFMAAYNLGFERDRGKISHKVGWDLQLFFSPFSWLPQQSQERFRSLNPLADHIYVYGRSSFNYKLRLPHEISCSLLVLGQLSNQSLLPSEQLGLGGFNTVRGYEERQLNTDDGVLVNFEILSPSFSFLKRRHLKDGLKCLAFIDYGWGHNKHKDPDVKQSDYLLGVGPGIRYALSRYFAARLDWGIKLHRNHFPGGWSMVHFSVMGSF